MNKVEIFNETNELIEELDNVEQVLKYALKKEGLEDVEFNVIIVDNPYIHHLNRDYRNIDRPTDVITFALEDAKEMMNDLEVRLLGDIYISVEMARSQSLEYGHSFLREITFLAVHGFYHLLGYNHETEAEEKIMFTKQEEVLSNYGKADL